MDKNLIFGGEISQMNIIEHQWNWAYTPSKRRTTDAIVVHHAAANGSAEDVHRWHLANGWAGIGYHFYIRKNGEVHRGRPLDAAGAQVLNHNNHTIGVCCEGNYHVAGAVMPAAQLLALQEVLEYLKKVYPAAAIKRHRDFGGSVCPGDYFPWTAALDYKNALEKARNAQKEEVKPVDTTPKIPWYIANGEWEKAQELGITDGKRPDDPATRAEVAAMIVRALNVAKGA